MGELAIWTFANPYVDPRSLESRPLIFMNELLNIRQQPHPETGIDRLHNTGLILWDACYILARFLERHFQRPQLSSIYQATCPKTALAGRRVLELGAGTGLAGLTCWLLGASETLLTDIDAALGLLRDNVAENVSRIGISNGRGAIRVAELLWGAEEAIENLGPAFDVILCSEVIYDSRCHDDLWKTLKAFGKPGTVIFFSYKLRGLGEEAFLENLAADPHFVVEEVDGAELDPDFRGKGLYVLAVSIQ